MCRQVLARRRSSSSSHPPRARPPPPLPPPPPCTRSPAGAAPLPESNEHFQVLATFTGSSLVGATYAPLFDYFVGEYGPTSFRVVSDTYVTDDAGTGIVHQAPAFGEDDWRVCCAWDVIDKVSGRVPCPVDANGRFTAEVSHFAGVYVKDADDAICAHLKAAGRLVSKGAITHSYPFCWRSETPLIYRAVPSWFVRVEAIKEQLLAANDATYWVPDSVKSGRFHSWLRDARDWAISRNRYWGTPLPIWTNDDFSEIVVVGSIAELEALTGTTVTDLHRESIDGLLIPSKNNPGSFLKRIEEVFDCWFESGAMPYAQVHYPFENAAGFHENRFPADFIAEGLDQVRASERACVACVCSCAAPAFPNRGATVGGRGHPITAQSGES